MTREEPILFSGPMVRAIRDGRKTQTRRVLKPQPLAVNMAGIKYPDGKIDHAGDSLPYVPGDLLWVRETWARVPASAYRASAGVEQTVDPNDPDMAAVYRAGWERTRPSPWRPSIHMPKWAARIWLRVTDVRVQRVQGITEAECFAEGVEPIGGGAGRIELLGARFTYSSGRVGFSMLWDDITGPGAWARNDWVAAMTFERVER